MIITYNPKSWFWQIGSDSSRFWSSADGGYVSDAPPERTTKINNEVELYDVLARAGLSTKAPQRTFTTTEVLSSLQEIDATVGGSDASALRAAAGAIGVNLPPDIAG